MLMEYLNNGGQYNALYFNVESAQAARENIDSGVRDVRDYRINSSTEKAIITGGSAYNINAESLRLGNFSKEEIIKFYGDAYKRNWTEI